MNTCFSELEKTGLIPVVTLENAADAVPLASALLRGGLAAAEITFRTSAAARAIAMIREREPGMLTGAGTVLTKDALRDALSAGALFIVAPGFNPSLAEEALAAGVPYIPGVMTPTEIEAAMGLGLTVLKFFPAEAAGGVKMLKSLSGPYAGVKFVPTGGITPENAGEYLALPNVGCVGGTWLAPGDALAAGDWARVTRLAEQANGLRR